MRSALLSRSASHTLIVRDLGAHAVIPVKKLSFDSVVFSANRNSEGSHEGFQYSSIGQ